MAVSPGYQELTCNGCGVSTTFYRMMRLKWKQGGGVVEELYGYACQQCHAPFDPQHGVRTLERRQRLDELKRMEEEAQMEEKAQQRQKAGLTPMDETAEASADVQRVMRRRGQPAGEVSEGMPPA